MLTPGFPPSRLITGGTALHHTSEFFLLGRTSVQKLYMCSVDIVNFILCTHIAQGRIIIPKIVASMKADFAVHLTLAMHAVNATLYWITVKLTIAERSLGPSYVNCISKRGPGTFIGVSCLLSSLNKLKG